MACSSEGPVGPPEPVDRPTYFEDVEPLVRRRCGSCHAEGGIGPFRLDTYDDLDAVAPLALAAIEARRMPPWMPDPECNRYEGERRLSEDEIEVFRAWMDAGRPMGDPALAPPPEAPEAGAE